MAFDDGVHAHTHNIAWMDGCLLCILSRGITPGRSNIHSTALGSMHTYGIGTLALSRYRSLSDTEGHTRLSGGTAKERRRDRVYGVRTTMYGLEGAGACVRMKSHTGPQQTGCGKEETYVHIYICSIMPSSRSRKKD